MDPVEFHGWHIVPDLEQTKSLYDHIFTSGAETCQCEACQNWVLVRQHIYPSSLLTLFSQLGIDPLHEAEVDQYVYERKPDSARYRIEFYFVGTLLDDNGKIQSPARSWSSHHFPFKTIAVDTEIRITQVSMISLPQPDIEHLLPEGSYALLQCRMWVPWTPNNAFVSDA